MTFDFITETIGKPRREVLVKLAELFNNPEELEKLLGENVLVDATVLLLAKGDPEFEKILADVYNVNDLEVDIEHVQNHLKLKKLLSDKVGGTYAGIW